MRLKNVLARARTRLGLAAAIVVALLAALTVLVGTTAAAAHPAPSLARSPRGATPAPHILNFAGGLRGARVKLAHGPSHVRVAWNVDGCDHDYGSASQCVPWTIPAPAPAPAAGRCAWLAAHGFGPLKVSGRDRLHLDTNHDGIACGQGDTGT